MDCIDQCKKGAISYRWAKSTSTSTPTPSTGISRRRFVSLTALLTTGALVKAQEIKVDGGLAPILDKQIPERKTKIVPPGTGSLRHMESHCTGCQLCVAACPNQVLRPSEDFKSFMQPHSSYERGFCRPECTACSEVCPTGVIRPIEIAEKSSIQTGHAVWIKENCIPLTKGDACGNCARHCPAEAITMIPSKADNPKSIRIPFVNPEKCIGCGACEYLCPSRPFSAIYVEGHEQHKII
jgi:ferredoxin